MTKRIGNKDEAQLRGKAEKKEIKQEVKETKTQVKELEKDADVDTHKMLDMVDKMDQKK